MEQLDRDCSKWIRDNIGANKNKFVALAPYYLGLLPYELYVLPGMFLAIVAMFFEQSFVPLHFHLLPHWFAFSIANYVKHNVNRVRPGCLVHGGGGGSLMDPKHCQGATRNQSFPSGHTCIAVALATTLCRFLRDPSYDSSHKTLMGLLHFDDPFMKETTIVLAFLVAIMISLHRVSYGYHNVSDVIAGALLGYAIGFTTYYMCNKMRNVVASDRQGQQHQQQQHHLLQMIGEQQVWEAIRFSGMALGTLAIVHFFVYKFKSLSALQH